MKKIAWALCLAILLSLVPAQAVLAASDISDIASVEPEASTEPASQPEADSASSVSPESVAESVPEGEAPEVNAEAQAALQSLVAEQEVMALVFLSDQYTVRAAASRDSGEVVTVPSGQQVQIQEIQFAANGEAWARVTLEYVDVQYEGFIQRANLACSDERFLAWEQQYNMNPPKRVARALGYADVAQFPAAYQTSLMTLKSAHPNWTFVKMNTGLDWNTVVSEEMKDGRSLVPNSFDDYMKAGMYGTQGWSYASEVALKYYLDPRNWLNEEYIFQFEQLTFNQQYHTEAAVQTFLNNTFMKGTVPQDSRTYARVFWEIGNELKVSPFHLASRVYSEQGVNGTSALISGNYPGFQGYYNYYNISASGSTNEQVVRNGLTKARDMGWSTPYLSIRGGADIISANYIRKGQDTVYLQKFDVDPNYNGLYWHQYMQSVFAPASEARKIRELYINAGALNNTFVFKIPVYNNMPGSACVLPTTSFNISVTPPAGYTEAKVYLDGVEYAASQQGGAFVVNAGGGHATSAVMYKYNGSGVPIGMYVWTLNYRNGLYTVTPVPELENLLTYHGFSIRITGKSGIRFKTGIGADTRSRLNTSGLAGFRLREYGTLVMNNANRGQFPFIKEGDKVSSGLAYGTASNGSFVDNVYESVDGRYRYTSVLTGLPPDQYKTEFAFRGYAVITRDGRDYTIYGPMVAKSINNLAQQVLATGQYPVGSSADDYLRKLIQDAG